MSEEVVTLHEDDIVEIEYAARRDGGDFHIKKVIGQVLTVAPDHFILGDIEVDAGPSMIIYFDKVIGIEHLPHPDEARELVEKSWSLLSNLPITQSAATDHIIKLTQLVQVLMSDPVSDQ